MSKGARLRGRAHHRDKIMERRDRSSALMITVIKNRKALQERAAEMGMTVKQYKRWRVNNAAS